MKQTLTPNERREINKVRDAKAVAVKPQGIQYEKGANEKKPKQKLSKVHNNRRQYDAFKS